MEYSDQYKPLQEPNAKAVAAYNRAKAALISAWGQGVRQKPLSGDALWCAELIDNIANKIRKTNLVREKYQRGLERLPFDEL